MEQRIDANHVSNYLLYAPLRGIFYWISPPPVHSELLGEEAGAICTGERGSYWYININRRSYKRSHLAFAFMEGRWPHEVIDHINGISTDDRWLNLREATQQQNACNRRQRKPTKHGLPMGVRRAQSGRYVARIGYNGINKSLGTFDSVEEAECVYLKARKKYFGEFA